MATIPSILTPQLPPDQRLLAALGQIKAPGAPPAAYTIPGIQPKPGDQGAELSAPKIASPGIGPAAPPAILNPEPSGGRIGPILSRMNPLHRPPAQPGDTLAKMLTPGPLGPPPAPTGTDAITAAKQAENAIQPPNYHGKLGLLEKVGDTAARLFAPGIEQRLGIGTLGYQDRLATAQAATDRAEKENATEAQAKKAASVAPDEQAFTDLLSQGVPAVEAYRQVTQAGTKTAPRAMVPRTLAGPEGKPVEANYDPTTGVYTNAAGARIENPVPYVAPNALQHVTLAGPDGKPVEATFDPKTGTYLGPGNAPIQNPQPYEAPRAPQHETLLGPDGKPHVYEMQADGSKKDLGLAPPSFADTGLYSLHTALDPKSGAVVQAKFDARTGNAVGQHGEQGLVVLSPDAAKEIGDEARTAREADTRYIVMMQNAADALNSIAGGHPNQQAEMSLLTNHIGMTLGLQKGARINQATFSEAEQSLPWLQGVKARWSNDGYLSGVALSPEQINQMLGLAEQRRGDQWRQVQQSVGFYAPGTSFQPPPLQAVFQGGKLIGYTTDGKGMTPLGGGK